MEVTNTSAAIISAVNQWAKSKTILKARKTLVVR